MREKNFSLKMAVEDIPNGESRDSPVEVHFGVPWFLRLTRKDEEAAVYLKCNEKTNVEKPWTIEASFELRFVSATREMKQEETISPHKFTDHLGYGSNKFISWTDAIEDNTAENTAMIYCDVTIIKMTGIAPKRHRSFEEPNEHLTDVVLKVGEEKFHVSKMTLAAQSPYFKALLLGKFDEAKKPEVELKNVDADVFQVLLEVIYGQYEIRADVVEDLLKLADSFDVPSVRKRCEEFLLRSDEVSTNKKLILADDFNLEDLMKECLESMKTSEDLKLYLPTKLADLSSSTLAAIIEKHLLQS